MSQIRGSQSEALTRHYAGTAVNIEYAWLPPAINSEGSLGTIAASARFRNGRSASLRFAAAIHGAGGQLRLTSWQIAAAGEASLHFQDKSSSLDVKLETRLSGKQFVCDFQAAASEIASMEVQALSFSETPRIVAVPYYSGTIDFFPQSGAFASSYFDWGVSHATMIDAGHAAYGPTTNGTRNALRERYIINISDLLSDVLPEIPNPKSPYIRQLAGATVLDIWNQQQFSQITRALEQLMRYGEQQCVVLIHNWQRSGYDNALPSHYPANAAQGGDAELRRAVNAARQLGCFVGLHQNYVDYYPNSDGFTKDAIALNSDGSPVMAWLNRTTHIQSFGARPSWFVRNAEPEAAGIHSRYRTNASFVDVNSAVMPWFRADMDSSQPGAGEFATAAAASKALWALERRVNGGPVFGEGLNHWYWSGFLDGVEAQLGAGLNSTAEHTPLFVDFGLLRIHPLQVNHGMGMYDRWSVTGESKLQTKDLDAYRMQEIAYGHAPYIGGDAWETPWQVLQEEGLVGPVAARYGTERVRSIKYDVRGDWVDSAMAVKSAEWSRVAVEYTNGDRILANGRADPVLWNGLTIPQYGWAAKGTDLLAYTASLDDALADYAQTADSYFANARNDADRQRSGAAAMPVMASFDESGDRVATMRLEWRVLDGTQGANFTTFVHFVDPGSGKIEFQADHTESQPTGSWRPGEIVSGSPFKVEVPASVLDGNYSIRVGLYEPGSGVRARLYGEEDGTRRYRLGTITVRKNGQKLDFQLQNTNRSVDNRMNRSGRVVNFKTLQTDGIIMLKRKAEVWELHTYPHYREVVVKLNVREFSLPALLHCSGPESTQAPTLKDGYWQIHIGEASSCKWNQLGAH